MLKDALLAYAQKAIAHGAHLSPKQYEGVVPALAAEVQGRFLVPRTTTTDLAPFRERFGIELPEDIGDYLNLFWHPYVAGAYDCEKQDEEGGYYKFDEGPILFSVLKHVGETDDAVLFQKYGVYDLTAEFYEDHEDLLDEAKRYICIGWTGYAAHAVLYEIATGEIYLESWREDRVADDRPIAGSLSELIEGICFPDLGR